MMELLSPAGSPEAVIAAVQNGADAVYLGFGDFNARRSAHNFTPDEFEKAVRYCRLRNCKVYVTLNTLVNDREMTAAVNAARMASEKGADAILVQDFGLAKVLRRTVPDIPLHASTQMSIHNLAGAEAAAQLGMTRVVLARELSLEEIRFISKHCSAETEVFVHGALCFCHSGQCYMSAMIGRRSGNRGMCAQPCRMQYSLGGRMDDYPLSLKDNCLANRLQALEEAGVACVKIEGRMKRPEYTGIVTGVYSKLLKEKRNPTPDEMELLARTFSRQGFTQGYLDGDKSDMFGIKAEPDEEIDSLYADARKAYSTGEVGKHTARVKYAACRFIFILWWRKASVQKPLPLMMTGIVRRHSARFRNVPSGRGLPQITSLNRCIKPAALPSRWWRTRRKRTKGCFCLPLKSMSCAAS